MALSLIFFLLLFFAVPAHAQTLNNGLGGVISGDGVFETLTVGPVTVPPLGGVNAQQYQVNGTPLGVANMGDYAAGLWQPTIFGGTTPGTPTYPVRSGSFEKIGQQVTVRFYISTNGLGGAAGLANIGGLPYPNGGAANDLGICSFSVYSGVTMTAGYTQLAAMIPNGQSYATMYMSGSGQAPGTVQISNLLAATIFVGMCNYHV